MKCFYLQIIWNSSTRAELLKFVDHQLASQGPDGSYDLSDAQSFVYKALSKELYVGNVYLRVYNDQPDFEVSEPEAFCYALLDFISCLVHNQSATAESDIKSGENLEGSSKIISDSQSENLNGSVAEKEQPVPEASLPVSDSGRTGQDFDLVKNLQNGLTSLKVQPHFCLLVPAR